MAQIVVDRVISQGQGGPLLGYAKTAQVIEGGRTLHLLEVTPGVYAPRFALGEPVNLLKPVPVTYRLS